MPSVLIAGASIAGPTLAWWLARAGFEVTLVERAPAPRPGGQAIDVRGAALDVLFRMDLLDAGYALQTRMKGVITLDAEGREVARSEEGTLSGGAFANPDFEILRDDLVGLLMGGLPECVETLYGSGVTGLDDDGPGVTARFEHGASRRFDLVVGADGFHSPLRQMTFGDERQFLRPVGVALAVYTVPNAIGLEDWQMVCRGGEANMCIVSPVRGNSELRLCYSFPASLEEERFGDIPAQKALLAERCASLGWHVPRLLAAMDLAPDFYLGAIAQVHLPAWSKGRVALTGDAAWCPSPAGGQGSSLALAGAYVLAQELAGSPGDCARAFARYEARMRPFVQVNQAITGRLREAQATPGGLDALLAETTRAIDLDAR